MRNAVVIVLVCVLVAMAESSRVGIPRTYKSGLSARKKASDAHPVAAVLPGAGGEVTGTLTVGVMNGISLFSNLLLARFALSWFPQLQQQFTFLRPINTVTEPYLRIFRQVIPPIGGFDISALPALFILDILSQTTAAVGAPIPEEVKSSVNSGDILKRQQQRQHKVIRGLVIK
jgi:YggT family protein